MHSQLIAAGLVVALALQSASAADTTTAPASVIVNTDAEPIAKGKFEPTWESLQRYEIPEWFRDAKFGIWAHWGPQCEPEMGDWYGRQMYQEGNPDYKFHLAHYGHPSEFGFKEVIHEWKAENWDPQKLVALYKRAGAQYFFALANHHDNFDLWDSKYQPWNSVKIGPQKDILAGWARAARDNGLRFGVSVHAAHAWNWYDTAQGADKNGDKAGIHYDGNITAADGRGKWWEGLDPQALYSQRHAMSAPVRSAAQGFSQWDWLNGASTPDQAYCDKFYDRTMDLINTVHPDLIYFDDTALPLWPASDAGLKLAAHYYNQNMQQHGGKLEAVIFGKKLDIDQRKAMVWDIERGQSDKIEPLAWQNDTCIGDWHYNRQRFTDHSYKNAKTVIQMLCDVVSKNGNLLLNIPVRGDGTIDDDELKVVQDIAQWMDVNKECIFGTRPWKVLGEGPALQHVVAISNQGFNEGKGKPFTAEDVRFTRKGEVLYVIALGAPKQTLALKSLGTDRGLLERAIGDVRLMGSDDKVRWSQSADALSIEPPIKTNEIATVFKVEMTPR